MSITTIAGTAGRVTGTAIRGILWVHENTDWPEVRAIVLQGLQVAIVLTLLAGRAARGAWDALPALSAKLGTAYARAIVPATKVTPMVHPLAGTRKNVAKRHLVAQLVAC